MECPVLDVFQRLTRRQRSQGSEGFQLEEFGAGERLVRAVKVRIRLGGVGRVPLYEKVRTEQIRTPGVRIEVPELLGLARVLRVLPQDEVFLRERPPGIT